MKRTISSLALAALLLTSLAACGGSSDGGTSDSASTSTASAPGSGGTTAEGTKDLGNVLALGEEFLLADLLSLGIKPIASTATVADVGWQGMDGFDTEGIQILPNTEANFEQLAALDVDTVIVLQYVVDRIGTEKLEALGDVIVAPTGTGAEALAELGQQVGRQEQATALIDQLDAAAANAKDSAGDDCEVTLATIYSGPTPAAWIAAPNNAAIALEDMGCTLVPSTDDASPDGAGRVYLSLERLGDLSAPVMILEQTDTVPGEDNAIAEIEAMPLWQGLPAVEAGKVTTIDRLGYPGAAGLIRLFDDLARMVG